MTAGIGTPSRRRRPSALIISAISLVASVQPSSWFVQPSSWPSFPTVQAFLVAPTAISSSHRRSKSPTSTIMLSTASSTNNNQSNRKRTDADRRDELERLSETLNVSPSQLKELLANQRKKMKGTEEKALHIDWLLSSGSDATSAAKHQKTLAARRPKRDAENLKTKTSGKIEAPEATETKRTRTRPRRPTSVTQQVEERRAEAKRRQEEALKDPTLLTDIQFANRKDLHPASKRALTETMGLTSMTEIQAKTYAAALSGRDVLGRARTGTGKTIAFLLPGIERVLRSKEYQPGLNIGVLVISPTRELAMQIGDEAEKLLTFHSDMSVQVVYGGTKVSRDVSRLSKRCPTILVATPGRLQDLLQTIKVGPRKFSDILSTAPVVVLDETDQLLDMGFRRNIKKILTYVPRNNKRQTLLFSATIPGELKQVMAETMKDDYIEVDCINDGGSGETMQTNARVKQSHALIRSMDEYVSSVVRVVQEAIREGRRKGKIVVFFPTARMVSFFADLFNEVAGEPVLELHSKKTQGYRNRVSSQFRSASSGLLFTSDVSARGIDYPGVTHVIQFGIPSSREQYIHRLGRTGRAGTEGMGWLILGPFESLFLEELKNIEVPKNPTLTSLLNNEANDETNQVISEMTDRVGKGEKTLATSASAAYQAFLGYYLGQMKRIKMKNKATLVEIANELSSAMGFKEVPPLGKNMVSKMGLKGVSGVVIKSSSEDASHNVSSQKHSGHADGRRATKPKRKGRR